MIHYDYLPRNDWKFFQWAVIFLQYLGASLARFNFPVEVFNRLTALKDDFGVKLKVATETVTRTKTTVLVKTDARRALEAEARQAVKEFLAHSRAVTDGDRVSLGIPVYKRTRTRAPVAKSAPTCRVDSSLIRWLIIYFHDRDTMSGAKPPGQHAVEMCWAILDAPPAGPEELFHSCVDTRSPFRLEFSGHERGKTVYFALRWENTRGEKGPWGEVWNAIIP